MLKKAGIVVTTVAASLVALSPLAFASGPGTEITGIDKSGHGLIDVSGNNVNVPIQVCNNDVSAAGGLVAVPVQKLAVPISPALGLLGAAQSESNVNTVDARGCGQISGAGDSVES